MDSQSGPGVGQNKKRRDRLIQRAQTPPAWVLGFADEVGWRRLAQPQLHSWVPEGEHLRLLEQAAVPSDPEPKARACYRLLRRATATTPEQGWLRFTRGQPGSGITIQCLTWGSDHLAALGKQVLRLVWANASCHRSQEVQRWLRAYSQQAKQTRQGVRIVSYRLPTTSLWLNPIEPKWVHGKRAIVEPERVLTAAEGQARVYAYYGCQPEPPLAITQKAA